MVTSRLIFLLDRNEILADTAYAYLSVDGRQAGKNRISGGLHRLLDLSGPNDPPDFKRELRESTSKRWQHTADRWSCFGFINSRHIFQRDGTVRYLTVSVLPNQ